MLSSLLVSGPPLPDQGEGLGVGIDALKRLIIERTEGNPFFMEEMVQALFELGVLVRDGVVKLAKTLNQIRVPTTVQAIRLAHRSAASGGQGVIANPRGAGQGVSIGPNQASGQ
jgi:hypothetical protein